MLKRTIAVLSALFLLISVNSVPVALAQAREANRGEIKNETQEQRCERITARIEGVIAVKKESKLKYSEKYASISTKLTEVANKLGESKDTEQLRRYIAELDTNIAEFEHSYNEFEKGVENSKQYACSSNREMFVFEISQSRQHLGRVRSNSSDIRALVATKIIPEIENLRDDSN